MQRFLTPVVLFGLLLACAAAFGITEHLKLIKSPVYDTHVTKVFSPTCGCSTDKATISFKLRKPDSSKVRILDADGNVVADLGSSLSRHPVFSWDGKTESGGLAPDGVYQPKIFLDYGLKSITMPNRITLDTSVPKVLSASDGDGTLTAGAKRAVTITYTLDQRAHVIVLLNGTPVITGHPSKTTDHVNWNGKLNGKPLPAGSYTLDVAAVDDAGNETPQSGWKRVVVHIEASK